MTERVDEQRQRKRKNVRKTDLVAEADEEPVVGVRIAEIGAALTGSFERLGAGAALQRRDGAVDASVLVVGFLDHQSGWEQMRTETKYNTSILIRSSFNAYNAQ